MARTEHTAGVPVLLRSMFEAIVDLGNLVSDASYHERMDAANLDQFLKVLRDSPQNPLLAGLDQKHDIATVTAELQAELDELRGQKGLKQLTPHIESAGFSGPKPPEPARIIGGSEGLARRSKRRR